MNTRAMLPPLTEEDLDRCIERDLEARRDAALQAAERRAARKACPPCHGDCNQGDSCPARLSALQQRVQADAQQAMPSTRTLVTLAVAVLGAFIVSGLAQRWGWF